MIKKWISAFLAVWLFTGSMAPGAARAEEKIDAEPSAAEASAQAEAAGEAEPEAESAVTVEERGLALAESSVSYPAVAGLADAELQKQINDRILEDLGVTGYLARMSQLLSGGSLRVTWSGGVTADLFSCAAAAEGAVFNPRSTFVWTCSNVDLRDGHEIPLDELFADPEAAREGIALLLEETVAPALSGYLLNCSLLPLPDAYWLTPRGIELLYPVDQLTTLSDRAGALLLGWNEIQEWLDLSGDGVPVRFGAASMLELNDQSAAALAEMTEAGEIPGLPVRLGGSVKEAADRWNLLTDPDIDADGRLFALEGAAFRNVFLLTDYLSEEWDESLIRGIRMDSGCLYGLRIGQTTAEEWRAVLGEPENQVAFDEDKAEAYRTVPGNRDYYVWGGHRLLLHSSPEGTLVSIILSE